MGCIVFKNKRYFHAYLETLLNKLPCLVKFISQDVAISICVYDTLGKAVGGRGIVVGGRITFFLTFWEPEIFFSYKI